MRRVVAIASLALAALAAPAAAPAAHAADPPYSAGAAVVSVTPPAFDAAQDAKDFPTCPAPAFPGPRPFRFEEPYVDADGSGAFNYPEPYCDANANGRYDGLYLSGAIDHLAKRVHDPIDARAFAISDGTKTLVMVSVVAQGIFENYLTNARLKAQALRPGITDMVTSANHNEGSPDTVGIYGAPAAEVTGLRSGIDEYYMTFLEDQIAAAAVQAYDARRPASLWARKFRIPSNLTVNLSHNFPTTDDNRKPAAIDPKVGVLEARGADGDPIFTVFNLAAHNQEIGHSGGENAYSISADWPGYFHRGWKRGGVPIFLVADNGSEEDSQTVPPVPASAGPGCPGGCFAQAQATGEAWAAAVAAEAPKAQELRGGTIRGARATFCADNQNNLFVAALAAGIFGKRQAYSCAAGPPVATGPTGTQFLTYANYVEVGPDFAFLTNPGEAFPALMLGSPWGVEEVGCPNRANPPIPTWRVRPTYRFQVGLADDLIGYEIPPWAFTSIPGALVTTDGCMNDQDDHDPAGHQHKLETEGVGPNASAAVANQLTALIEPRRDPAAVIRPGRFVRADGTLTRRPDGSDAVAVWLADPGATALVPGNGTLVALRGITGFGAHSVTASGVFMDYDGADQPGAPDVTTRGMLVYGCDGFVSKRYYLDVFPALSAPPSLGKSTTGTASSGCVFPGGLSGAAGGSGIPLGGSVATALVPPSARPPAGCVDRVGPVSRITRRGSRVSRTGVVLRGVSRDTACGARGVVASVSVAIAKSVGKRCRFVRANGRLTGVRSCKRPVVLGARGTRTWTLRVRGRLPHGGYRARARGTDVSRNGEHASHENTIRTRIH